MQKSFFFFVGNIFKNLITFGISRYISSYDKNTNFNVNYIPSTIIGKNVGVVISTKIFISMTIISIKKIEK